MVKRKSKEKERSRLPEMLLQTSTCAPPLAADRSCDRMYNEPRGDLLVAFGGRVTAAAPCFLMASAV